MFKKPLSNLKTSAPLRSSDRRKLKQRIVAAYGITSEEGDILVPDGLLSIKFSTHVEEPGVVYTHPDGNPLWFTLGKNSEDLIPTVYTLWKKQDLLPFLSTPAAVVPILIGGADLMIPGVIHCPMALNEHQLVAIRQYSRKDGKPALSPPVAVGRMALPSDQLRSPVKEKGKAVHVIQTWKDHLWDMGSKGDIPADTVLDQEGEDISDSEDEKGGSNEAAATPPPASPAPEESEESNSATYTPAEVTELLHKALLQAISTTLKVLPSSSFPIPATQLYSNYILPCRPAFPTLVIPPSEDAPRIQSKEAPHVETEITIKASSHKSLTTFLKAAEKASLLTLKPPQKQQPDVLITAVNVAHPEVASHKPFATAKDIELTAAKKAAKEEKANEAGKELEVRELWKPHQSTVELFEEFGVDKHELFSMEQIRSLLNGYITAHDLVNPREQAYINLDDLLYSCAANESKSKSKGKDKGAEPEFTMDRFMKRDELTKKIVGKMQSWYEVKTEGKEPVTKKGTLKPIQVVMKVRQGRKVATLISGFEPFLLIDAEVMAEDLRKACAGATSVSPIPGKPAGSGSEVLVQGKQSAIVLEYLLGKGIPKKWVEVHNLSGK
ncbi:eukaryotic translation initiation factor SUI1 family protein [Pholiota conissans]|uniref:Eukaryotic translation initiation factor SUI1 family protein n=1 Tax=Pholiota conissans TaxID=109636 RepID=A0A9P5YZD9_9AGAR|nr:eukaryotic translation initiation factor SUI1 family protein [Pholiota conissans]